MHHCRVLAPWNPKMLSHFSHDPSCCRVTYICHALDICHVCVRIAVSVRIHDRSIFKFRCKSTAIFLTVQFNTSFLVIFFSRTTSAHAPAHTPPCSNRARRFARAHPDTKHAHIVCARELLFSQKIFAYSPIISNLH